MSKYEIGWKKFKFPDDDDDEEDDEGSFEDTDFDEDRQQGMSISQVFPQQINPFYQLKEFNFWTAHTNFKISPQVALIIGNVAGVETLDIISPYRFHMSVGLRFDEKEIKLNVTQEVILFLEQNEKNKRN